MGSEPNPYGCEGETATGYPCQNHCSKKQGDHPNYCWVHQPKAEAYAPGGGYPGEPGAEESPGPSGGTEELYEIYGRVTDDSGELIRGGEVTALGLAGDELVGWILEIEERTDHDGGTQNYRIFNVPKGEYQVLAKCPPTYESKVAPPTYVLESTRRDFTLRKKVGALSVTVSFYDDPDPPPEGSVTVKFPGERVEKSAVEDGAYRFGEVVAGSVTIETDFAGYENVAETVNVAIGEKVDYSIVLGELKCSLTGHVIGASSLEDQGQVTLVGSDGDSRTAEVTLYNTWLKFRFEAVPAGSYRVKASFKGYPEMEATETLEPGDKFLVLNLADEKLRQLAKLGPEVDFSELRTLDLSGLDLEEVPVRVWDLNLTSLDLSRNRLKELPQHASAINMLQTFDLSRNELTVFPEIFRDASFRDLKTLDLSNNKLSDVPAWITEGFESLTQLNLSGNEIPASVLRLAKKAMENLDEVTELDLSDCGLEEIPELVFKLTELKTLDLSGNRLAGSSIDNTGSGGPAWSKLSKLRRLDLSGNGFTKFPLSLQYLPDLTTLDLSGNDMVDLPLQLTGLEALTTLNLSGNQLKQVPEHCFWLEFPQELDLSGNEITKLPASIRRFSDLEVLDLSGNKLTELPTEIGKLTSLTTLNLSGNKLEDVPSEIAYLIAKLETLDLSGNLLEWLSPDILLLQNLKRLDLSRNRLKSLAPPGDETPVQGVPTTTTGTSSGAGGEPDRSIPL